MRGPPRDSIDAGTLTTLALAKHVLSEPDGPEVLAEKWLPQGSPRQVALAVRLVDEVASMLSLGHADVNDIPAMWDRLESAYAVLRGTKSEGGKRRAVVRAIESVLEPPEWYRQSQREWFKENEVLVLTSHLSSVDERFHSLDQRKVASWLRTTKPRREVAKGGAGSSGPILLAAKLSVSVGAFGDDDVKRSKARFLAAEHALRGKRSAEG